MFHGHLLGLYEKALPAEWSWERRLSAARELGFDYMEISIDETDGAWRACGGAGRSARRCGS